MMSNHLKFINLAHDFALKNLGKTFPNPSVGCIISKNNKIISIGVTSSTGRPHAEEIALKKAGKKSRGATMYVTLEPCSMCLAAIVNSRIKTLIYGLPSPKYGAFSSNHSSCQNTERIVKNTEVYGGFYQLEISRIMKSFFEDKRGKFNGNRY